MPCLGLCCVCADGGSAYSYLYVHTQHTHTHTTLELMLLQTQVGLFFLKRSSGGLRTSGGPAFTAMLLFLS